MAIGKKIKKGDICVRKCVFCSNSNRNKENCNKRLEISSQKFAELVNSFSRLNVKGISVAGGGEPLSYNGPLIEKLILGVNFPFKVGLHTNGVLLEKNIIDSNKLLKLTESKIMFGVKILLCRENIYFAPDMVYYFKRLGVDPDGEVYLCSPWSKKEYSIGNVNQTEFCKIWGSSRHREVVGKLNDNLQSGKCNPLLCRHWHGNLAIDAFVAGLIKELPKKDMEKGFGRFV